MRTYAAGFTTPGVSPPPTCGSGRDRNGPATPALSAAKGRAGHFARPEGPDEPFRARALAEPALQRTDPTNVGM